MSGMIGMLIAELSMHHYSDTVIGEIVFLIIYFSLLVIVNLVRYWNFRKGVE
jgi:DMSO/TMAO reductase YedYZ heme-binding membrane subunit